MATMWNPTPEPMKGRFAGILYHFPSGKKIVIKTIKRRGETNYSEDIARRLYENLGPKGLILIDEENPLPMNQYERISIKTFCTWIRGQIHAFNEFNQKQAAENLAIKLPSDSLKHHQSLLTKLEGQEEKIVTKNELEEITSRAEMNAYATLFKIVAAAQTGDMDAVRAALPEKMIQELAGAAVKEDPEAPVGVTDSRMAAAPPAAKPIEAAPPAEAKEPERKPIEAAPSVEVQSPDTKKPAPDFEREIVTPERPQGHGAGRIPTSARTIGGPGQRSGGPPAQE